MCLDSLWVNHPTGYTDSMCLRNNKGGSSKYLKNVFYFLIYNFHGGMEVFVFLLGDIYNLQSISLSSTFCPVLE